MLKKLRVYAYSKFQQWEMYIKHVESSVNLVYIR